MKRWLMWKPVISVQALHSRWTVTINPTYVLKEIRCCSSNFDTVPTHVRQQQPSTHKTPNGRNTKKKDYLSKTRRPPCQPVLDRFDEQYSRELGEVWSSARSVLLEPDSWQYGVMLNRFASLNDITNLLQSKGFSSFPPQAHAHLSANSGSPAILLPWQHGGGNDAAGAPPQLVSTLATHDARGTTPYPHALPEAGRPTGTLAISSSSSHLSSTSSSSLPIASAPPSLLQCFLHPRPVRFPSQVHWQGVLKQYYLLNAASLLPVLALQLVDGDKVLDLCSAPGGKALAIMQTANPGVLCCNESDPHRKEWLSQTLESFLPLSLSKKVILSNQDGRSLGLSAAGTYDKVLVDAPCSNDRSWLYSPNSQQGELRLTERASLPALQAQLLRSALCAVRPGGVVVYSTCTMSTNENAEVVGVVLDSHPEAELEDLWEELARPYSTHFTFIQPPPHHQHHQHHQHHHHQPHQHHQQQRSCGLLVVPTPGRTWGPMYICRIRRRA